MSSALDFFRWLGEAFAPAPARPPRTALGMADGAAAMLRLTPDGYVAERPAAAGDAAPLYLDAEQALTLRFFAPPAAARHGADGARIEAARRCPFPVEPDVSSLTPIGEAWTAEGAPWLLAAAPRARVAAIREEIAARDARPGPAFTLHDNRVAPLAPRKRDVPLRIAAAAAALAACAAAASAMFAADATEGAARERLAAARAALDQAEAAATTAAAARTAAATPMTAARAAGALFAAAPPAGRTLAALSAAAPDTAYARRVSIRPGAVSVEIAAPDVAALATAIGAAPAFTAARLATGARVDAASGMQRATLDIIVAPAR